LRRSYGWIAAGIVAALLFVVVLGSGLHFGPSAPSAAG